MENKNDFLSKMTQKAQEAMNSETAQKAKELAGNAAQKAQEAMQSEAAQKAKERARELAESAAEKAQQAMQSETAQKAKAVAGAAVQEAQQAVSEAVAETAEQAQQVYAAAQAGEGAAAVKQAKLSKSTLVTLGVLLAAVLIVFFVIGLQVAGGVGFIACMLWFIFCILKKKPFVTPLIAGAVCLIIALLAGGNGAPREPEAIISGMKKYAKEGYSVGEAGDGYYFALTDADVANNPNHVATIMFNKEGSEREGLLIYSLDNETFTYAEIALYRTLHPSLNADSVWDFADKISTSKGETIKKDGVEYMWSVKESTPGVKEYLMTVLFE